MNEANVIAYVRELQALQRRYRLRPRTDEPGDHLELETSLAGEPWPWESVEIVNDDGEFEAFDLPVPTKVAGPAEVLFADVERPDTEVTRSLVYLGENTAPVGALNQASDGWHFSFNNDGFVRALMLSARFYGPTLERAKEAIRIAVERQTA